MLTGVPAATWLGQQLGWRSAYWLVVVLAAITMAAVLAVVPSSRQPGGDRARRARGAAPPQVLLTLLVGVVGFGGMFALYSYIAPGRHRRRGPVPRDRAGVLLVYGAGGVIGTALGGRLADLALFRSLVGSLVFLGVLLAVSR